jgi:hypothetical protein
MEPVTLISTALAAGASAGAPDALKDDVKEKVKAAYAKLHGLVKKRVTGRPHGDLCWPSTSLPRRSGKACSPPSLPRRAQLKTMTS